MIDMHVHILPGVDDGSRNAMMTQEMLRRAVDVGITRIVATPHVYTPEDQARNRGALPAARALAHEAGLPLSMGCELNYRALRRAGTQHLDAFCLGMTRCLLLEFGNEQPPPGWEYRISELMDNGYLPIIAHPERYIYIQRDIAFAQAMTDLGCELQVDAGGLMAPVFSAERRAARRLAAKGMVSYIASDAHRPEHYETFGRAYKAFAGEIPRSNRLVESMRAARKKALEEKHNG